ncbi:hypothetical protein WYO_0534 [Methylobacterium sp. GXF4]|uniref:hypothetical protein n=1 Tax=Methylobacterium sp. GXF4 TaxID=1096546 RepID=UPI000269ABE1|nr:hypothetical protein [Methylobacterium sp. GXF4]EIZ86812.1 hypothetical protein WYO_0534 [Methylobacterium sp. GXF4]
MTDPHIAVFVCILLNQAARRITSSKQPFVTTRQIQAPSIRLCRDLSKPKRDADRGAMVNAVSQDPIEQLYRAL